MSSKYRAATDLTYHLQLATRHSIMIEANLQQGAPIKELTDMLRQDLLNVKDAMVRLDYAREPITWTDQNT